MPGRTIGGLVVATLTLWSTTLLLTAGDATSYHRLLTGVSSAMLVITGMVIYLEQRRSSVVQMIVDRLGRRFTSLDEVLSYGISIGREEERAEHYVEPVLLSDYRKPEHCPPDCECRNGSRPNALAGVMHSVD